MAVARVTEVSSTSTKSYQVNLMGTLVLDD
jgi:hypothetical protein